MTRIIYRKIIRDCFPPAIVRLVKKAINRELFGRRNLAASKKQYQEDPDLALYQRGRSPFLIDAADLRYSGGLAFNEKQHHFIKYYYYGRDALKSFYDNHQPKDIFEQHCIQSPSKPVELDALPWSLSKSEDLFRGEEGLDHSHGRQQYGPVSKKKIELEASRLDKVLNSIVKFGYREELGYPRGYFLQDEGGRVKFVIVGGQHRAAALIYLKVDPVPVTFQPDWPRVIRRSEVQAWPQVKAGNVSVDLALEIFDSYFRDPGLALIGN